MELWCGKMKLLHIVLIALLLSCMAVLIYFIVSKNQEKKRITEAAKTVRKMAEGDNSAYLPSESEGELSKLFHEINSLNSVLNAHTESKEKSNEFLKNTIQDISHQLKTPIAALSIYNGILQDDNLDKESEKKFVDMSEKELERMEALVQNLLKITKLDSHTLLFDYSKIRADEFISALKNRFKTRAEQEGKTLFTECENCELFCDVNWTTEAVGNIVKNALDHTESGNTIKVSCRNSGTNCCIEIEDNGCGIHEEDLFYIFRRFYRSRFSKDSSGIGLGLALSKSIIENQNGTIEVKSVLGKGSTFSIYLPNPTEL